MGYSSNTGWIVTCVQWIMDENGIERIGNVNSQSYRKEANARVRFCALMKHFEDNGYSITPLEKRDASEQYEGFHGKFLAKNHGSRVRVNYFIVFIDRNPPS